MGEETLIGVWLPRRWALFAVAAGVMLGLTAVVILLTGGVIEFKSIADFTMAITLEPEHVRTYNSRGVVYNVQREYELAIADFTKTIELNFDKAQTAYAYMGRGDAYHALGQYERAEADYAWARELTSK